MIPVRQEDNTVACAMCLAEGRPALLQYDFARNWYVCPIHGPQVTGEFLWYRILGGCA